MGKQMFSFFLPVLLLTCAFSCSGVPGRRDEAPPKAETPLDSYYAGRIEKARTDYETLLSRDKDNALLKRQLVVLYRELGEYQREVELLEDLLKNPGAETDPGDIKRELYKSYYLSGQTARAAELRKNQDRAFTAIDDRKRAEVLFYDAMIRKEQRRNAEAVTLFKESLKLNRWRPIAWYHLGLLLSSEDPKEAEECFRTCISQDSAFSEALFPLGKLLLERKSWRQAVDILSWANQRIPGNRAISAALAEARRNAPGTADELAPIRRTINAKPPKVSTTAVPGEGTIRIGLAERRTLVSVKAGGDFRISLDGTIQYRGKALDQIWISWKKGSGDGILIVQDANNKILLQADKPFILSYYDPENTSIVAGVVNGSSGTNRTYRGTLEFRSGPEGMTVVNTLNVEEYLYGVVPAEMPVSWPEEALKAQSIAARSYTLANIGQFEDKGFDLYGTPYSMAYRGVGNEHKNTTAAVDATRGIILKGGGELLKAFFSANHGGYSEDTTTMWGYEAHMSAVPDKLLPVRSAYMPLSDLDRWIQEAPPAFSFVSRLSYVSSYRWEKWVTPAEIRRRLDEDPGDIEGIVSRGRGISGRIYELEVKGSKQSVMVRGDAIWNAMGGLRSSLFTIRAKQDKNGAIEYFIFQGAGHGHGIGMDQHGAAGMAGAGYKAEEILHHYYPKAELIRL